MSGVQVEIEADVVNDRGSLSQIRAGAILRLCRPGQWVKNVFVLAPLLFSQSLGDPAAVIAALVAVVCFCLWSSAVYCCNDVIDAGADGSHPRKCLRPVPAGQVSPALAWAIAGGLLTAGVLLAWWRLPLPALVVGGLYLANGLLYCLFLKRFVIIDVILIAIGFVLRLLAGCAAIRVEPSSWLLVCGFSLAMLLGFGKRRSEIGRLTHPTEFRHALQSYTPEKLNVLLGASASLCLLAYMLYTVSPQTVELHHTGNLVYTVPIVAYGVFRYIFKVQEAGADGPTDILLKDYVFALTGLLWLLAVGFVLYLR